MDGMHVGVGLIDSCEERTRRWDGLAWEWPWERICAWISFFVYLSPHWSTPHPSSTYSIYAPNSARTNERDEHANTSKPKQAVASLPAPRTPSPPHVFPPL